MPPRSAPRTGKPPEWGQEWENEHYQYYKQLMEKNENTEIYKTELNEVSAIEISDEGITLGDLKIEHYHDQDCCESVYADWEALKYHTEDIVKARPKTLKIKGVEGMGFLLAFTESDHFGDPIVTSSIKVFIPCYNSQNGYYGDDLRLKLTRGEVCTTIDITKFVEDDID